MLDQKHKKNIICTHLHINCKVIEEKVIFAFPMSCFLYNLTRKRIVTFQIICYEFFTLINCGIWQPCSFRKIYLFTQILICFCLQIANKKWRGGWGGGEDKCLIPLHNHFFLKWFIHSALSSDKKGILKHSFSFTHLATLRKKNREIFISVTIYYNPNSYFAFLFFLILLTSRPVWGPALFIIFNMRII